MISVSSIKEIALDYYDRYNWFVFPAHPTEKKPFGGFRWKPYGDSRPDRSDLSSWREWDARGVRLAARTGAVSGIFVLDCDSREALEYVRQHGHEPTPMVQSGREGGGQHIYFRHPGFKVKNATNLAGIPGMDIRGEGGIVIVPPSPHASGRNYEWIINPDEATPAPAPQWLLDLLKQEQEHKEPLNVSDTMAGIPEGQRDSKLFSLAAKLRNQDIPYEVALAMLEVAANNCNPPFPLVDARKKVDWVWQEYSPSEAYLVIGQTDFPFSFPLYTENGKSHTGPVSLGGLDKPKPREWLVDGLIPMKYPTTLYGTGGVSKSYLALSLATAIAFGSEEWMGFRVKSGQVLYLDFELEVEEQTRRAYEVATGFGLERPPQKLFYQSAGGMRMKKAFGIALEWCINNDAKLLLVDSTGLALEGDSQSASDVISFFREILGQFVLAGVCVLLIDHQSKMQSGENYQKKTAFGSGYKEYLSRSSIQVELIGRNEGEITVRFRQKKTNFGALVEPFELKVEFSYEQVAIERVELDDSELASEESLGAEERVIRAVRHLGDATPAEAQELSNLAIATVRKHFSQLKKREVLLETGELREGAHVCSLKEHGFPLSIYKGKDNGKDPDTLSENTDNPENTESPERLFGRPGEEDGWEFLT